MASAYDTMTKKKPERARDTIGLSTVDTIKARNAYNAYRIEGGELPFEAYVDQVWKPGNETAPPGYSRK